MKMQVINNKETMTSTELAALLGYTKSKVNEKIRDMFAAEIDGSFIGSSLDSRGYVAEYHLPEVESNMFVARWDYTHLRKLADFWVSKKGAYQLPDFTNPAIAARAWADEVELKQLAEQKAEQAMIEVDRLQGVCQTMAAQFKVGMTTNKFCSQFNGVNIQQVNKTLVKLGKLRVDGSGYSATSVARDVLFKSEFGDYSPYASVLPKGAKWLYRAYLAGKLPMKKSWDGAYVHLTFDF